MAFVIMMTVVISVTKQIQSSKFIFIVVVLHEVLALSVSWLEEYTITVTG